MRYLPPYRMTMKHYCRSLPRVVRISSTSKFNKLDFTRVTMLTCSWRCALKLFNRGGMACGPLDYGDKNAAAKVQKLWYSTQLLPNKEIIRNLHDLLQTGDEIYNTVNTQTDWNIYDNKLVIHCGELATCTVTLASKKFGVNFKNDCS